MARHRRPHQPAPRDALDRAVYGCDNAELQWKAHALGAVGAPSAIEAEKASAYVLQPGPVARAWQHWSMRVAQAGQTPAR